MTEEVLVLGHKGMLGNAVQGFLSANSFKVATIEHRWETDEFKRRIRDFKGSHIVNCIGIFKQTNDSEMRRVNLDLPVWISKNNEAMQLVAGSDAEFSGQATPGRGYAPDAVADPVDEYGKLKHELSLFASHSNNMKIIRCSIIGVEIGTAKSLLSWFLAKQDGTHITGYTNHIWNGITTLQWARLCLRYIKEQSPFKNEEHQNILQPVSSPISKFNLLKTMNEVFSKQVIIEEGKAPVTLNRSLLPGLACPEIKTQLKELKEYYGL